MHTSVEQPLLEASGIVAGYSDKVVVRDVSLSVYPLEKVAIIGHNGAGKSTLLRAIYGLLPLASGEVRLAGAKVGNPNPLEWRRRGVSYSPQGNHVFRRLTVQENISVVARTVLRRVDASREADRLFTLFPVLGRRKADLAGSLSGGQQQTLALALALVGNPQVILLDEPSLGLDAKTLSTAFETLSELPARSHASLVVVEQKVREVLAICNRAYVLRTGKVSFEGPVDMLTGSQAVLQSAYL